MIPEAFNLFYRVCLFALFSALGFLVMRKPLIESSRQRPNGL